MARFVKGEVVAPVEDEADIIQDVPGSKRARSRCIADLSKVL